MPTNYPTALDDFANPAAGSTLANPPHHTQHGDLNDAVEAIEAELGLTPSGASATVRARLDALGVTVFGGSSFPAQPAYGTAVPFYRTDLAVEYVYDGAAWQALRTVLPLTASVSVTADLNNLNPGNGGFIVLACDASPHNITGMVASIAGESRIISNDRTGAGGAITLKYNSASSAAGNKFAGNSGADKVLAYQQSVLVVYDGTYWIMVG